MSLTVQKCLQAWTNSLRQMNVKADIVFFGNSLTFYGDFSSVFPDKVVCNLGLRGDTLQGMIDRVEQVRLLNPKVMYVMAGINDVANNSIGCFSCLFERLLLALKDATPNSALIVQNLLPVNNNAFTISYDNYQIIECNKRIKRLVDKYSFRLIDLYHLYQVNESLLQDFTYDGIHLTESYYEKWYRILKQGSFEIN